MPPKLVDLTGQTINGWRVTGYVRINRGGGSLRTTYIALCPLCGVETHKTKSNMQINRQCITCKGKAQRKTLDIAKLKHLRSKGVKWKDLKVRMGLSTSTMQRRGVHFERRNYNWAWRHFGAITKQREQGLSWKEILNGRNVPYSCETALCGAYNDVAAWKLTEELEAIYNDRTRIVHELTAKGLSAQNIAETLGLTARCVVRHRSKVPRQFPTLPFDRINYMLGRGADWRTINDLLDKPCKTGVELRVLYNFLLDVPLRELDKKAA